MRYAPGRLHTLGAIATEVLLVAGLLDSSCIYRWGHDGEVRRRAWRMSHFSPSSTTTWTSRTRTYSYCAAKTARSLPPSALRGHEGGSRGGRQGRLLEGDRGER